MRGQTILIVDDEAPVAEAIAAALADPRRRIIVSADTDAAAAVLERYAVSLVLTDVRMSHPFGYEGLELVRRVTAMHATAGVVVMTGLRDPEVGDVARSHGASLLLHKPFELAQIETFLATCPQHELAPQLASAADVVEFPDIDRAIASPELGPVFQPIVDLESGRVVAAEALARLRSCAPFNDIALLLDYAERRNRILDLDLALVARSLAAGAAFARRLPLFVNVHPSSLGEPDRFIPTLMLHADRAGIAPSSIVVEITEHSAFPQHARAIETLDALRRAGVRFALDDVGSAYSHLSLIDRIQPSFLKISQEFGTDFERDQAHTRIVRNIAQLGRDFGLDVVLEGVESPASASAARELGIALGQGFHFARPAPLGETLLRIEAAA